MIDEYKLSQYNQMLVSLYDLRRCKELYLYDFDEGTLQQKRSFGWLYAKLRHIFYLIVDCALCSERVKEDEKAYFQAFFKKNTTFLIEANQTATATFKDKKWCDAKKLWPAEKLARLTAIKEKYKEKIIEQLKPLYVPDFTPLDKQLIETKVLEADLSQIGSEHSSQDNLPKQFADVYHCMEADALLDAYVKKTVIPCQMVFEKEIPFQLEHYLPTQEPEKISKYAKLYKNVKTSIQTGTPTSSMARFTPLHQQAALGTELDRSRTPTANHLKSTFHKILHTDIPHLSPPQSPQAGAFLARYVHYVMGGEKQMLQAQPSNEMCFPCQELQKLREEIPVYTEGSAFAWLLKQKEAPEDFEDAIQALLVSFWGDIERLPHVYIGDHKPIEKVDLESFRVLCQQMREAFFQLLKRPSKERVISNCHNAKAQFLIHINMSDSNSITTETLRSWCKTAQQEWLDLLIEHCTFTDEQLSELIPLFKKQISIYPGLNVTNELNQMLLLQFLQYMFFTQQRTFDLEALFLAEIKSQSPLKRIEEMLNTRLCISPSTKKYFRLNGGTFSACEEVCIAVEKEEAENKLSIAHIRGDYVNLCKWNRSYNIPEFNRIHISNDQSHFVLFENIQISPHAVQLIDTLVKCFAPKTPRQVPVKTVFRF